MPLRLWLLILAAGLTSASAEPLKYLELAKSEPVEVNGLEFVAATQTQWLANSEGSQEPIEIQLLITNRSGHDLVFRTFDTFAPILRNTDGTEVPRGGGRWGTRGTPSVLIHAGDTYWLSRKSELWWKLRGQAALTIPDGKGGVVLGKRNPDYDTAGFGSNPDGGRGLLYWDGTGMLDSYKPLKPGSYRLSFSVGTSDKEAATETRKLGGLPVWAGAAETKSASFEIIEQ